MKKRHLFYSFALASTYLIMAGQVHASEDNSNQDSSIQDIHTSSVEDINKTKDETLSPKISSAKVENKNDIVRIKYNGPGKVAVWDNYDANRKITNNYLANGTSWKSFKVANLADNSKWYNLGGAQWVDSQYVIDSSNPDFYKNNWIVNSVNTTTTTHYTGRGQIAVWNNYDNKRGVIKYIPRNTIWKVFKEAIPQNGYVWYNLGGNQWITSKYSKIQKFASDGQVSTKTILNQTAHQPFPDPLTMRNPMQWMNSSETKAYPNLRYVNNLSIRVSILGNRTYVMSGNKPIYTMYCSAGKIVNGKSLTPTGTYYVQPERGLAFSSANNWVSWKDHGVYLFHSPLTNSYNGPYNVAEANKLGSEPRSLGCIRLTVSDSKWFYNQLPIGTKVVIANN